MKSRSHMGEISDEYRDEPSYQLQSKAKLLIGIKLGIVINKQIFCVFQ